jgi:hypothetical protein
MNGYFYLGSLIHWMVLRKLIVAPVTGTHGLLFAGFGFEKALRHGDYKQYSNAYYYFKKVSKAGHDVHFVPTCFEILGTFRVANIVAISPVKRIIMPL